MLPRQKFVTSGEKGKIDNDYDGDTLDTFMTMQRQKKRSKSNNFKQKHVAVELGQKEEEIVLDDEKSAMKGEQVVIFKAEVGTEDSNNDSEEADIEEDIPEELEEEDIEVEFPVLEFGLEEKKRKNVIPERQQVRSEDVLSETERVAIDDDIPEEIQEDDIEADIDDIISEIETFESKEKFLEESPAEVESEAMVLEEALLMCGIQVEKGISDMPQVTNDAKFLTNVLKQIDTKIVNEQEVSSDENNDSIDSVVGIGRKPSDNFYNAELCGTNPAMRGIMLPAFRTRPASLPPLGAV